MTKFLLIIDTAFETCQVGLWQGNKCITMAAVPGGGKHDIILAPLVDEIFKVHKVAVKDIEKIAVTIGPGRFTGLRVGIAFARGLALIHKTPLVGVQTTDALRWQADQVQPDIAIIVAVKRGESFIQRAGQPIDRVMDSELADYMASNTISHVAGVLSPEAQAILSPISNLHIIEQITEPSLEAIYAVSGPLKAGDNSLVRPYYTI